MKTVAQKAITTLILTCSILSGCCHNGKSNLMQKSSDVFPPSQCKQCSEKPFYVNGRWLNQDNQQ